MQLPESMPGPQQPGQGVWPPSLELVHNATLLFGMQSACLSSPWLWLSLCSSPWSPLGMRVTFFQSWNGGFCFYDTFHAHITMETRVCARTCLRAGREQPCLPRHCGVSPPPVTSLCVILSGRDHHCPQGVLGGWELRLQRQMTRGVTALTLPPPVGSPLHVLSQMGRCSSF